MKLNTKYLDKLIEEATTDAYNESEQAGGFFAMIEENLVLPFVTQVLGLAGEADASRFAQAIESDPTPRIGTPALLEASIVLTRWYGDAALAAFTREAGAEVIAFDLPQLRAAQAAYLRFGKGRHPAGLNFGNCMSYALAQASGEPLLYEGNDFSQTDIEPALTG